MYTFMFIPDTEKFLQLVKQSRGEVVLHLPDGSQADLKRDRTAQQLLRVLRLGRDGLQLSLPDPHDERAFLRYMQEAALYTTDYSQRPAV